MLVGATVAEQAIRYPTDLSLLNEAREIQTTGEKELPRLLSKNGRPTVYSQNITGENDLSLNGRLSLNYLNLTVPCRFETSCVATLLNLKDVSDTVE